MGFLNEKYKTEIISKMMEEFSYSNVMQVPKVEKVVLNMGLGDAVKNSKVVEPALEELTAIAGQRAVVTRARRSIAGFGIREGMPIGAKVTLRGSRMYEFLERLIYISLPRVRDFKGVSDKAFDGRGNYSLGIKEQIIFPEIDYDKVATVRGLNISIVTTAHTDDEARQLLRYLGMPFPQPKTNS